MTFEVDFRKTKLGLHKLISYENPLFEQGESGDYDLSTEIVQIYRICKIHIWDCSWLALKEIDQQ